MQVAIKPPSYTPDALSVSESASSDSFSPLDDTLTLVRFFGLSGTALDVLRCIKGLTRTGQQLCYLANSSICEQFNVCRSTAQRAIRELQHWQLITVQLMHTKVSPNTRVIRFNTAQVVAFGNNSDFMDKGREPIDFKAASVATKSSAIPPLNPNAAPAAAAVTVATTVPAATIATTQDEVVAAPISASDSNPVQSNAVTVTSPVTPDPVPVPDLPNGVAGSLETASTAVSPTIDATSAPVSVPPHDVSGSLETASTAVSPTIEGTTTPVTAEANSSVLPLVEAVAEQCVTPSTVSASASAPVSVAPSTALQDVMPEEPPIEKMSPFAQACIARMRKDKDFSPAGFVQHRLFLKQFSDGVSDEELAEYGLKRSDCVPLEVYLEDVPAATASAPKQVAAAATEPTPPTAAEVLSKDAMVSSNNLPKSSADSDSSSVLPEDNWPECKQGTVVVNADAPCIEASMDELLTAMQAESSDLSFTEVLLSLAANQHGQSAAHQPLSASELALLPATDPRMAQHNQWPLQVFTAPNSAKLPIHCDLYRFDFTERIKELRLGPVVFWGDCEPQLCFDFAPMAEFLSAAHASAELDHYSWNNLKTGFEQFFRFSMLSELCYYSEDMFACPEDAPCCNVAELKKFFATHQRGMLLQMLAVSCGVTDGPYHDADNDLVQWCSDSLWRSISRNMHLYPNTSPLPFLTACVRRQLVKSFADESAYNSMLQIFTREFLSYAQQQQWVSYFNYYGFGPEFMRFVYPADFMRLMHVDYQRSVFRLTYPMLLWRKIACVRAAAGLELCNDEENSNIAASLLVALAYNEQMQEHWGQFVSAFCSHYPFLAKVGGCAHV